MNLLKEPQGFFVKYTKAIVDLFYPNVCHFCGGELEKDPFADCVCRKCAATIPFRSEGNRKIRCVNDHYLLKTGTSLQSNFSVLSSCYYSNPIKHALLMFKFYEEAFHKKEFGKIIYESLGDKLNPKMDVILPIPLHDNRRKERGYNQAELIGEELSSLSGIPILTKSLIRIKRTKRQSESQSIGDRMSNLVGSFVMEEKNKLLGKRVLLLDDVLTTGATMFNASLAIRNSLREQDVNILGIVLASDR